MTALKGTHGKEELSFDDLNFSGQAQSINGQISRLEKAIKAHIRRANYDNIGAETREKCIGQLKRMIARIE
jgi:hypothetical protein